MGGSLARLEISLFYTLRAPTMKTSVMPALTEKIEFYGICTYMRFTSRHLSLEALSSIRLAFLAVSGAIFMGESVSSQIKLICCNRVKVAWIFNLPTLFLLKSGMDRY